MANNYLQRDDAESASMENVALVEDKIHPIPHYRTVRRYPLRWPWILSTFILALMTFKLVFFPIDMISHMQCPKETSFKTDLEAARPVAEYHEILFTGGIEENEQGRLYRVQEPGQVQYVGAPSQEIDTAWNDLLFGIEVILHGDEAMSVANRTTKEPGGGWRVSVDVFHSLHCVDQVRRGLDMDYYHPKDDGPLPYYFRDHLYHCVDYLRQVVQCHGDLTPLRYGWSESHQTAVPLWGESHTCRDFAKIREWAEERSAFA